MTTVEEHKRSIKEFADDISEKIRAKNIFERQKIIGFDVSEGSTNLFEFYLHKKKLITEGFNVNHRFFSSERKVEEKFPFNFPQKEKIISFLVEIENLTTKLCYGRSKKLDDIEKTIKLFFELKGIIEKELGESI